MTDTSNNLRSELPTVILRGQSGMPDSTGFAQAGPKCRQGVPPLGISVVVPAEGILLNDRINSELLVIYLATVQADGIPFSSPVQSYKRYAAIFYDILKVRKTFINLFKPK